jgi:hypothetical protein
VAVAARRGARRGVPARLVIRAAGDQQRGELRRARRLPPRRARRAQRADLAGRASSPPRASPGAELDASVSWWPSAGAEDVAHHRGEQDQTGAHRVLDEVATHRSRAFEESGTAGPGGDRPAVRDKARPAGGEPLTRRAPLRCCSAGRRTGLGGTARQSPAAGLAGRGWAAQRLVCGVGHATRPGTEGAAAGGRPRARVERTQFGQAQTCSVGSDPRKRRAAIED